jgi:hypothetical protein
MADIDTQIQRHIESFVRELSALVREAAVESVQQALGGRAGAHHAVKTSADAAPARRAPAGKRGGERSPEQIAATVNAVLAFIKAHPKVKSEVVRKEMKLARPVVQDAIDRLKAAKKVTMKGTRRAAQYTAA